MDQTIGYWECPSWPVTTAYSTRTTNKLVLHLRGSDFLLSFGVWIKFYAVIAVMRWTHFGFKKFLIGNLCWRFEISKTLYMHLLINHFSSTTTTSTISITGNGPSMSIDWHDCTITGEGSVNNPDYCLAFYESEDSVVTVNKELDCCWTANEHSTLPALLRDVVTVHSNGTMYLLKRV